jgi:hypothetical protein
MNTCLDKMNRRGLGAHMNKKKKKKKKRSGGYAQMRWSSDGTTHWLMEATFESMPRNENSKAFCF